MLDLGYSAADIEFSAAGDAISMRQFIGKLSEADEDLVVLSPAGVGRFNFMATNATLEFGIWERAMVGFGFGAAMAGSRVIVDLPFWSFGQTSMDLLGHARNDLYAQDAGSLILIAPFGPGVGLGVQHECGSLSDLASTNFDNVVVPYSRIHVNALLSSWHDSGELWLMAMPVAVMLSDFVDEAHRDPAGLITVGALGPDVALAAATIARDNVLAGRCIVRPIGSLRTGISGVETDVLFVNDRIWQLADVDLLTRVVNGNPLIARSEADLLSSLHQMES